MSKTTLSVITLLLLLFSVPVAALSNGVSSVPLSSSLPLPFEPNRGQAERDVDYVARGKAYSVSLKSAEAVVALEKSGSDPARICRLHAYVADDRAVAAVEAAVVARYTASPPAFTLVRTRLSRAGALVAFEAVASSSQEEATRPLGIEGAANREMAETTVFDAEPEGPWPVPKDTYLPFFVAVGLAFVFLGLLTVTGIWASAFPVIFVGMTRLWPLSQAPGVIYVMAGIVAVLGAAANFIAN